MLRVEFINDRTGADDAANYRVQAIVNGRMIAAATVKGHPRAEHWTALLRRCADQNACLAGDGNQQPSGLRGDLGAPRTVNDDTRDTVSPCISCTSEITRLQGEVEKLTKREADHHDIIARLWAVTDPDIVTEMPDLMPRVHQALGVDDPEGDCGNVICGEVLALTAQLAKAEATLAAPGAATLRTLIDKWRATGAVKDTYHATMGIGWKVCADDLAILLLSAAVAPATATEKD